MHIYQEFEMDHQGEKRHKFECRRHRLGNQF